MPSRRKRECEVCFSPTRNRKPTESKLAPFARSAPQILCNECRAYVAYWNGLSPADRAADLAAMAAYADATREMAREPWS